MGGKNENDRVASPDLKVYPFTFTKAERISKFSEFISPAEVALVCLIKFILSFIKFCSLVTTSKLWLICGFQIKGNKSCTTDTL